jgi:hypothetical protein
MDESNVMKDRTAPTVAHRSKQLDARAITRYAKLPIYGVHRTLWKRLENPHIRGAK